MLPVQKSNVKGPECDCRERLRGKFGPNARVEIALKSRLRRIPNDRRLQPP
jgi:hypothetical protein